MVDLQHTAGDGILNDTETKETHMRIRSILAATAVAAATATAVLAGGAAHATVAVNDGVGHVDKGDVQSAFGWNNPDFDKNVKTGTEPAFTSGTYTRTTDNVWSCTNGVGEQHRDRVTVMAQKVTATPTLSSNGKQINGWDLTGTSTTGPLKVLSDTGIPADVMTCPAGSSLDFTKPLSINQVGVAKYNTYTTQIGDLQVTIGGVTKPLPNTR